MYYSQLSKWPIRADETSLYRGIVNQIDEAVFGSVVNPALIKQAVVGYHANLHQGSAANKGRGQVSGGTLRGHGGARVRKAYRQKGTGHARAGSTRSPIWRGGATT